MQVAAEVAVRDREQAVAATICASGTERVTRGAEEELGKPESDGRR
jgi:hypothetical protein